MIEVEVAGRRLALLPQRAAFFAETATLLVADVHLGKAVSFRRLGVPVPQGTTTQTLGRLSEAIAISGARHVVFLGDLLHSALADGEATYAAVRRWRRHHAAVALTLVRGNHDQRAGDPPDDWGIERRDAPLPMGPFALAHHPEPSDSGYTLAGHVHPSTVFGRGHDRLRLPCFHFGERVGVLPAFGEFTGTHTLTRGESDRVYAIVGDTVRALPA